jgi:L,D-transpeptidase catalytic domain
MTILPTVPRTMNFKPLIALVTAATTLALIPSCSNAPSGGGSGLAAYQAYDRPTKLPGNPQNVKVKVSLSKQRTYVMEGSEVLLVMPVSVGTAGSPTPAGNFTIYNKEAKRRANTHGYAYSGANVKQTLLSARPAGWSFKGTPMPYWCEFKPAYGFHTGWLKHHPCTHGCIRMHENLAPKFFRLVSIGTPVSIAYSQPEDATVGNIPLPPDAGPLPDYPSSMYVSDGYFTRHKSPHYN